MRKKVETEPVQIVGKALTINQLLFVECLLTGASIKAAAKACKVTDRTCRNWLLLPHVKSQLASGTEALLTSSRERIELLSLAAVDTLQELMLDAETPATVRATCARALASRVLDAVPVVATDETPRGVDYSAWSADDLATIYPLVQKYEEKKQA